MIKSERNEFGETEMRDWWKDADYMNTPGEKFITDAMSEDEIVQMMRADLGVGATANL